MRLPQHKMTVSASVRKRNEFLEGEDSEGESENGYDSDAEEGRGAIASKRRRIDTESEASFDGIEEDAHADGEAAPEARKSTTTDSRFDFSQFETDEAPGDEQDASDDGIRPKLKKSKALKEVEAAAKKTRKSGVLYISRVPPFMKPQTLKHFLEPHAAKGLGRIFLTPEDHTQHSARVKRGGNKKKSYTDGWVEFNSKTEAKVAAEALNGNIIGGKKGGYYHDDIWNIKYLKGFKWQHLTEQIANENAERASRLKQEIWKTRKENKQFVEHVERGKMLETRERKKRARMEKEGGAAVEEDDVAKMRAMEFKQKKARRNVDKNKEEVPFNASASIVSKIF